MLAKKGATYQNVYFASDGEAGKFTTNIFAYPTTYVVDRNGNIVGEPHRRRHHGREAGGDAAESSSTRPLPPTWADKRFRQRLRKRFFLIE